MSEMYARATGIEIDEDELLRIGRRVINVEKAFNVREGATRKDDTIPWRFMNEPIRSGPCKGMITSRDELDKMLNEYYQLHGWDKETGFPMRNNLEELELEDVAEQLERLGKIPIDQS
jgi:aldehyde:ferredoxin oxidoreductase